MPRPLIDIRGQRFGRLTVVSRDPTSTKKWICQCDCGNSKSVSSGRLRAEGPGATRSCGCLLKEMLRVRNVEMTKHGLSRTPEYGVWRAMIQRCEDKSAKSFKDYGARGIKVCKEWRDSFERFYIDMGPRPFVGAEIDREDNDGNYEKSNCRWVTRSENIRNRRSK